MPSKRKPPGMNQGPEIYDPNALINEYSRSEREKSTRFANRRWKGERDNRKFRLRLLLLDILLLCIIGGVIYPFIVERNRAGQLDDTRCRLELRRAEEDVLISLNLKTKEGSEGNEPVDITISVNGQVIESLSDLTPAGGMERTLRYSLKGEKEKLKIEVLLKNEESSLRLNAVSSAAE